MTITPLFLCSFTLIMGKTSTYCASAVCNMWHEMVMEKGASWLIAAKKYVSLWQEQREDVVRDVRIMSPLALWMLLLFSVVNERCIS